MKESLLSVGIDIGTSTTQLVFSRITLENTAAMISVPRIAIADKAVIYRSGIHFTPLMSPTTIDGEKVRRIIEMAELLEEVVGIRPVTDDLAKALGQTLYARLQGRKDVICIDTVKVENGDCIDIGRALAGGSVVPVIVKTLLFSY